MRTRLVLTSGSVITYSASAPFLSNSNAVTTSSACLISEMATSRSRARAAACTSGNSNATFGLSGLAKIANRRRPGTTSRNSSTRLPAESVCWIDIPVRLPPGRARLATRPVPTGSPDTANTIGITALARFIAIESLLEVVTMTSTLRRTNSAAISATRSGRPCAQRCSIATVRSSLQPSSRRRCRKAEVFRPLFSGLVGPRYPMVGNFAVCRCAFAASGHAAAAPPSRVMNSRRANHSISSSAARVRP